MALRHSGGFLPWSPREPRSRPRQVDRSVEVARSQPQEPPGRSWSCYSDGTSVPRGGSRKESRASPNRESADSQARQGISTSCSHRELTSRKYGLRSVVYLHHRLCASCDHGAGSHTVSRGSPCCRSQQPYKKRCEKDAQGEPTGASTCTTNLRQTQRQTTFFAIAGPTGICG